MSACDYFVITIAGLFVYANCHDEHRFYGSAFYYLRVSDQFVNLKHVDVNKAKCLYRYHNV